MTVYFTRLISVSAETLEALEQAIPSLSIENGCTFEHESDNEQEVAHWFRGIMLAASTGGAQWLTPVSLEKEQRWMDGENLELFLKAKENYGE